MDVDGLLQPQSPVQLSAVLLFKQDIQVPDCLDVVSKNIHATIQDLQMTLVRLDPT